jgi:anti-sigma B factor antagonist
MVEENPRPTRFALSERALGETCAELRVVGELDLATAPELDSALERLVSERRDVLVDLGECEFVDSVGLATILRARRRLRSAGRTLHVSALSRRARRTFEVSGLDTPELVRSGSTAGTAPRG